MRSASIQALRTAQCKPMGLENLKKHLCANTGAWPRHTHTHTSPVKTAAEGNVPWWQHRPMPTNTFYLVRPTPLHPYMCTSTCPNQCTAQHESGCTLECASAHPIHPISCAHLIITCWLQHVHLPIGNRATIVPQLKPHACALPAPFCCCICCCSCVWGSSSFVTKPAAATWPSDRSRTIIRAPTCIH